MKTWTSETTTEADFAPEGDAEHDCAGDHDGEEVAVFDETGDPGETEEND